MYETLCIELKESKTWNYVKKQSYLESLAMFLDEVVAGPQLLQPAHHRLYRCRKLLQHIYLKHMNVVFVIWIRHAR